MAKATTDVIAAAPTTWAATIRGARVCLESSATENPAAAPPHALLNQSFLLAEREEREISTGVWDKRDSRSPYNIDPKKAVGLRRQTCFDEDRMNGGRNAKQSISEDK